MGDLFREARLKIERAKKHVNDLDRLLNIFIHRKPYEVFVEHDANASGDLLKVKATETLGADFVLTLGDAIHNLRTSLDFAMNEIEFRTVGERTTFTKFPIYETRDGLIASVNGGLKKKAPKEVIDCIRDTIQPYKGGRGMALWVIHQLDIEDKHRLLIANTELNFIKGIRIEDDCGVEHTIGDWMIVPDRVAQYPIKGNRNVKINHEGNPTYVVSFGQGTALQGKQVIPAVSDLVKVTESVLVEIEYWFKRGVALSFRA